MRRITFRRIGLTAAAAALVVLVALTAFRVQGSMALDHAVETFEETVGPLDFEAYRPPSVVDRENAALPVLEAMARLEAESDDRWRREVAELRARNRRGAGAWSPDEVAGTRELLASRAEVLALLHRAARRTGSSYRLDYPAGPEMEIPKFLLTLEAAELLFAEARLAWLDRRPGDAVRAVESLAALARTLEAEGPLLFQIVGQSVEILQYRAIADGVATAGAEPEALRRLRATAAERSRPDLLRRALGAEGSLLYALRRGGPFSTAGGRARSFLAPGEDRLPVSRTVAAGLDYYREVVEAMPELSYAEMLDRPDLLAFPVDDGSGLVVELGTSVATFQATEALARLTRLALDLALEGAEAGTLPNRLPATPEAGPDPFTATAPVYQRAPDGSATLTLAGADELWREVKPKAVRDPEEAPLFLWRLAAPGG